MERIQQRNAKEKVNGNETLMERNETALHATKTGTFFVRYCRFNHDFNDAYLCIYLFKIE